MRVAIAIVAACASLVASSPADAHERRTVGPYQLVVGWLNEPAVAGELNAVDLRVTDTRTTPPRNVEGLQDTLTVDVVHGGLRPVSLKLRARFGQPGAYAADVTPTIRGAYRFVFRGRIEDVTVSERDGTFESGPGRFDDVEDATALQYPPEAAVGERIGSLERELGVVRALAIVALTLAVVLPLANAVRRRRT